MLKKTSFAFSIAEALITLMIVSLILSAVIPVISKRQMTSDSMWKYISAGTGANSSIFYGLGTSQTALIGSNAIPVSSSGSRLILFTPVDSGGTTIARSIIDFYQSTGTGPINIGKVSFDQCRNTAMGKGALASVSGAVVHSTGDSNTAFGESSLTTNTTGRANSALGAATLQFNTTGNFNTAMGVGALYRNTTGNSNTAVGVEALRENTTAISNTAVGHGTLYFNTTGYSNSGLGVTALYRNTTGYDNVAIGVNSLYNNQSGYSNTAVGTSSMNTNLSGLQNTAIGHSALVANIDGDNNVAVGASSQPATTTGNNNVSVGSTAMWANTSGSANVAVGEGALRGSSTSSNNVALGFLSCQNVTGGTSNICLGYGAGPTTAGAYNNQLFVDNMASDTPLIRGDFGTNTITINGVHYVTGNSYTNGATLVTSDKRLKNIIGEYTSGIEKLNQVHTVRFVYKNDKQKRVRAGVIAQEMQKIFPDSVQKGENGNLYVDNSEILYSMVNAVKDMYKKIQTLIAKVTGLEAKVAKLEKENRDLKTLVLKQEAQNKIFEKRLKKLELKSH